MPYQDSSHISAITMEDHLGIVYLIETAQQFWSELEDILKLPSEDAPTLSLLDSTLRRFISLCATYHQQYLQSPLQLEHACNLLIESELFQFHSERMCEIIAEDARNTTDPHSLFLSYHVLYYHGHRRPEFFRLHKRWQPLFPLLMDHILVGIDPDIDDTYVGTAGVRDSMVVTVPVPIEAKLRSLGVKLLYEVCRVQKLSVQDLRIFNDSFLDYLFDLVEETRYMHDETFNYSVIKLIAALNEQFMVAILPTDGSQQQHSPNSGTSDEPKNRLIRVLMRRLGSSKTFGENMIFMLNRAKRTPEDLCMQLLLLKILYVLFTTKGTSEYFYTNDLCVLVDVFLRELVDLDEESDSLRHTYLRVLHPLLTKTQLRDIPYKRSQILVTLESLIRNHCIRDVNPTTKRLVDRCLSGDWCVQLNAQRDKDSGSPTSEASTILSPPGQGPASMAAAQYEAGRLKSLKFSKSVENLGVRSEPLWQPLRSPLDQARVPTNGSHTSLPGLPTPSSSKPAPNMPKRRTASTTYEDAPHTTRRASHDEDHHSHRHQQASSHPRSTSSSTPLKSDEPTSQAQVRNRRPPPPAPPKRRKPPAIPLGRGITMQTIKSSEPSPLSNVFQPVSG